MRRTWQGVSENFIGKPSICIGSRPSRATESTISWARICGSESASATPFTGPQGTPALFSVSTQ